MCANRSVSFYEELARKYESMTLHELAAEYGVSYSTVYVWLKDGETLGVPYTKRGRGKRFKHTEGDESSRLSDDFYKELAKDRERIPLKELAVERGVSYATCRNWLKEGEARGIYSEHAPKTRPVSFYEELARKAESMTQRELAAEYGVFQQTIGKWLKTGARLGVVCSKRKTGPYSVCGAPDSFFEELAKDKERMTSKDIAAVRGVSEKTVYRWLREGERRGICPDAPLKTTPGDFS